MYKFVKCCFGVLLAGMVIVPLLFSACTSSRSKDANEFGMSVVKQNIETLCSEGYSEEEINRLMDILAQLNQPVALGTEKITETGTYIKKWDDAENYSEEYLWFLTNAEEKYYVYIQRNSQIIYFVCKGELDSGEYIYRTYQ